MKEEIDMAEKLKTNNVLAAVVQLIVGIILMLYPHGSLNLMCRLAGCGILIYGIVRLADAIREKETGFSVAMAVIFIIVGVFFLAKPETLASIAPLLIGVVLIANGIINLSNAFSNKEFLGRRFGSAAAGAMLVMILGVVIILNPFSTASMITRVIGISLLLAAVENLISIVKK